MRYLSIPALLLALGLLAGCADLPTVSEARPDLDEYCDKHPERCEVLPNR